ncbi:DJ-1/PfpI family protein [Hydrogenophaga laconesensis]|uniref:catalase n=1 Tax=Hydrogenophaga laconesensis TaxID=1805971 RepID=A0ABU1V897_9BURK|nr:DJ-1/PfpI family protein [Hydrogenophaga laconesensis]MDR7093684.1 putative intracellular protease/amidase [Hydrogenophaga laconesensis]
MAQLPPTLQRALLAGDHSIRARKIAILVAHGVEGQSVAGVHAALLAMGAHPCYVAPRIGPVKTADGVFIDAEASLENEPGFLFDAMVLPDGVTGVQALDRDSHTRAFIRDQHGCGKAILAMPASLALLDAAGVSTTLPSGQPDPGVVIGHDITAFIRAVVRLRHPERHAAPPTH